MTDKEIEMLIQENQRLHREIKEWERCHQLDTSEIVRLRRQIEFLIGHDNP